MLAIESVNYRTLPTLEPTFVKSGKMLSNPADVLDHLRSDITFKTYSDSKLASLYLDNPNDFPIHVLRKVLDVVLDPLFKTEEITFRTLWDMFDYISDSRRQPTSMASRVDLAVPTVVIASEERPYSIPSLAVSLVVDRMTEDRLPLGDLAGKQTWKDAYKLNVAGYHSMSLVHSTWTPIARRALQRRVVVPYYQIDRFLLSPLCGPWITEMIVYWTIDNGDKGATRDDVDLLGDLWERTPQLRSLAFVSSLTWPSYKWEEHDPPPFRVSDCLELVTKLIPHLENLWLRHICYQARSGHIQYIEYDVDGFGIEIDREFDVSAALEWCDETDFLLEQLAGLRQLKFLSMERWGGIEPAGLEQHPALETVILRRVENNSWKDYTFRSRAPREVVRLHELTCSSKDLEELEPSTVLHLEKLQLRDFRLSSAGALKSCHSLLHLEFNDSHVELPPVGTIPPSLRYLKFESRDLLNTIFPGDDKLRTFCDHIRSLPHLRKLVFDMGSFSSHIETTVIPLITGAARKALSHPLIDLCNERGIRFLVDLFDGKSIQVC